MLYSGSCFINKAILIVPIFCFTVPFAAHLNNNTTYDGEKLSYGQHHRLSKEVVVDRN